MKILCISILFAVCLLASPVFAANLDVQVSSYEPSINFRTGPSTSAQVIMEIPNGTARVQGTAGTTSAGTPASAAAGANDAVYRYYNYNDAIGSYDHRHNLRYRKKCHKTVHILSARA